MNQERILKALATVEEPDLKKDLVTLKMVKEIAIAGNEVSITIELTTPACPLKDKIENDCINAIVDELGAKPDIKINFTSRVWGNTGGDILPDVKNVILVSSGKGGVGKSTIAVNLALALKNLGAQVGVLDADIYGPSMPTMLNLQGRKPQMAMIEDKQKIIPLEKYGLKVISIGFLIDEAQAVVWRGPMASSALRQFFTDVHWGPLDYLVIDMPPGTGDIHLSISSLIKPTGAIVVTTPQKVAISDARKGAAMYCMPAINVPLLGIVENMSFFETDELPGRKFFIYGKGGGDILAQEFGLDVLARLPVDEKVAESGDMGLPVVNDPSSKLSFMFTDLAQKVAQKLSILQAQTSI